MDPAPGENRGLLVTVLEIKSLNVAYGSKQVLHDISLTTSPGEIVALIGPNGAGKSTLIRAISGVIPIMSGSIVSANQDLIQMSTNQRARVLSVVPQIRQLGGAFTVEQTVMIGRTAHMNFLGQPSRKDHEQIRLAMQNTNTNHLAHRRVAELSGGEQQRVLLARALAQDTPVLLLDEPTNHLDLKHQAAFLSLVRTMTIENGLAVIMALHDLNLVSLNADRVALVVEGHLSASGVPKNVLTAENISAAYQTPVQVIPHPDNKNPLILPARNGIIRKNH